MTGPVQPPAHVIAYPWMLMWQVDRVADICTKAFEPDKTSEILKVRACIGAVWVLAKLVSPLVSTVVAEARLREAFRTLDRNADEALRMALEALETLVRELYGAGVITKPRSGEK